MPRCGKTSFLTSVFFIVQLKKFFPMKGRWSGDLIVGSFVFCEPFSTDSFWHDLICLCGLTIVSTGNLLRFLLDFASLLGAESDWWNLLYSFMEWQNLPQII